VSALYAWVRRHPLLVDSVLAVLIGLLSLPAMISQPWPSALVTVLVILPIVVRRRIPVWAFVFCLLSLLWQLSPSSAHWVNSDVSLLVLIYTVAAYRPRRDSAIVLAVYSVIALFGVITWGPVRGIGLAEQILVISVLFYGSAIIAFVLGDSVRYRRGYYAALEDKAARLEAERHAQAGIAAAAERARIARELHDVVAHHVSVMVVQADGAGYALRTDPGRAETALSAISSTGRQALTEMRRLLGVLRETSDQTVLAPVPGLGELRELLDQARNAGLEVTYTLAGTPRPLSEGAELAAYRVVQESLTNTRKHAGLAASAAVALRYEPHGLTVQITDNGLAGPAQDTGGHGLAGMRERIAMYGGTVQAGPLPGGGFGVTAHLPCPDAKNTGPEQRPADAAPAASQSAPARLAPGPAQDGLRAGPAAWAAGQP
jgi:signal transduction histidine kinase